MAALASLMRPALAGALLLLGFGPLAATPARAHRLAPALLELREAASGVVDVTWKQSLLLPRGAALEPVLPAHCNAGGEPQVSGDLASVTLRFQVDCGAAGLVGSTLGVRGLEGSGTAVLLRAELEDGRGLRAVLSEGRPELRVPARDSALAVVRDYLRLGAAHIWAGLDHLAFVLGLLLLVRDRRTLLLAVTSFSVGHSVTLSLAVLGFVGVPPALAELAIAVSILVLALELAPGGGPGTSRLRRRPYEVAALFGLVHGLGFAGALLEAGLPQTDIPLALFSFNLGIELGQIAFVAGALLLRAGLRPLADVAPRWLAHVPAYTLGTLAAFWCLERVGTFLAS